MSLRAQLETGAMNLADAIFAWIPQKRSEKTFKEAKMIAHRGHFDNRTIFENTVPAFKQAMLVPCYGVEFDLRWSKDGDPMVSHDDSLARVFGINKKISNHRYLELKEICPSLPHISEVISEVPGAHLMIELKGDKKVDWQRATSKLKENLGSLRPALDFHLMSFETSLFKYFSAYPSSTFLPIAKLNVDSLSQQALKNKWAGIAGHYTMIGPKTIELHHRHGQVAATGIVKSLNSLYREINRGADYIFTDRAQQLFRTYQPSSRA